MVSQENPSAAGQAQDEAPEADVVPDEPLITHLGSVTDSAPEIDSTTDTDSNIGDLQRPNSTASLSTSVYDFEVVHGRTYHKYHKGKYLVPNDESEMDRLDLQNHIWLLTLEGEIHLAPLPNQPLRVLDLGCGTGIWAIDFASRYPSSHVIGSDLSPIQPNYIPPNCQFEVDDAEDDWVYSQPFHYIHGRTLMNCFKSMHSIFTKAFQNLHPGGYFEMQDGCLPFRCADHTLDNTALLQWCDYTLEGSARVGRKWADPHEYKSIMEDVGFVDVVEKKLKWPLNTWPKDPKLKELGMWVREDMSEILPAVSRVFTMGLGWSMEDVDSFLEKARADLMNRKIHGWIDM